MSNKRPTAEQIVELVVAAGATAEQGAASAISITNAMSQSPNANDYLTEFNNKIEQRWNDLHSDSTIYDKFKSSTSSPTLQAVAYERIAPVTFNFMTEIETLPIDEQTETRKIPQVHSILRSLNIQNRFKTTSSQIELDKIQASESVSVDNIISNLGMSYADDRTEKFKALIDSIESNKTSDEINAMSSLTEISKFVQSMKYYTFKFKEMRTDIYNAYKLDNGAKAKADTKMSSEIKPICFISPKNFYKIEGDYYATLFQLQQALPDVDFVEIDGMTGNKFAILCDPRVVEWSLFGFEITSEHIRGRETGELNHYLFAKEIMATYNCFNRVVYKTE